MVVVSCPHCYRAQYLVLDHVQKKVVQTVRCSSCKQPFVLDARRRTKKVVDVQAYKEGEKPAARKRPRLKSS
jgi:predicted Zn finger-like uncharacterized protein